MCASGVIERDSAVYEFEADRTAIKLIGREGVIEGILFMSRFEGLTAQRKARLGALGHTEG